MCQAPRTEPGTESALHNYLVSNFINSHKSSKVPKTSPWTVLSKLLALLPQVKFHPFKYLYPTSSRQYVLLSSFLAFLLYHSWSPRGELLRYWSREMTHGSYPNLSEKWTLEGSIAHLMSLCKHQSWDKGPGNPNSHCFILPLFLRCKFEQV